MIMMTPCIVTTMMMKMSLVKYNDRSIVIRKCMKIKMSTTMIRMICRPETSVGVAS